MVINELIKEHTEYFDILQNKFGSLLSLFAMTTGSLKHAEVLFDIGKKLEDNNQSSITEEELDILSGFLFQILFLKKTLPKFLENCVKNGDVSENDMAAMISFLNSGKREKD